MLHSRCCQSEPLRVTNVTVVAEDCAIVIDEPQLAPLMYSFAFRSAVVWR